MTNNTTYIAEHRATRKSVPKKPDVRRHLTVFGRETQYPEPAVSSGGHRNGVGERL